MNLKRFTARTSREALALVRQAFGDDAVVMSTRPCAEGVEVLAMAPESVQQLERVAPPAGDAPRAAPLAAPPSRARQRRRAAAVPPPSVPSRRAPTPASSSDVERAADEHAVVPGLRARAHAQAPPGRDGRPKRAPAARAAARRGTPTPRRPPTPAPIEAAPRPSGAVQRAAMRRCCASEVPPSHARRRGRAPVARRLAGARRPDRDADRAALDARPDRAALRRAGLHGKAAAPAAPGRRWRSSCWTPASRRR